MADEPVRYRVLFPDVCREQLREIAREAARLDIGPEIKACLELAEYRLKHEANDWGESREYLSEMKLELRVGFARILTVFYALDSDNRIVYLRRFRLHGGQAGDL